MDSDISQLSKNVDQEKCAPILLGERKSKYLAKDAQDEPYKIFKVERKF